MLSIEPLIPNGKAVNFPNWLKLVHVEFSACGVYVQTSSTLIMSENETLLEESTWIDTLARRRKWVTGG